jgi:seryl-tRNA synthetase
VPLARSVPADLRADVAERLSHAASGVVGHEIAADGSSVTIALAEGAAPEAAAASVSALVDGMTARHRDVPRVVVFEHRVTPRHTEAVWDELVAGGLVSLEGAGLATLAGDAVDVVEALDRVITTIARGAYGARPRQYPTLIATEALDRAHYFSSFPHHATFALHVRDDLDAIDAVASRPETRAGVLAGPAHVLSPAVCFHAYVELRDRPLAEHLALTARGRCFRWESRNFETLERLWDFSLREIIFLGPEGWVEDQRRAWVDETARLVESLELDAWIETANDPFFIGNFVAQRYFQLVSHTKYELRLALPYAPGRSLAAASYNLHRDYFGRSFGIAEGGGFAHTSCVGFGLERFAWALFAQHGPDLRGWPATVRRALSLDG